MAVLSSSSPWTTGTARIVKRGGLSIGTDGKATCEDVYAVILADGTRAAAGRDGIPAYGAAHPDAGTDTRFEKMTVKSVTITRDDPASNVWKASVVYGGSEFSNHLEEEEEVEDGLWVSLRIGSATVTEDLTTDMSDDEKPVVNGAGDPFENVPQVERSLCEITLAKRTDDNPASLVEDYDGTINSASITICGVTFEKHCGRVKIEAERQFGDGGFKWIVTYRLTKNPATWDVTCLECGYRYKDAEGNLVKFTDVSADGRVAEASTPRLITTSGEPKEDGEPEYSTFQAYPETSWSGLHLPSGAI